MTRASEQSLARALVAHLTSQGWTCHEEVEAGPGRCDVVAVREVEGARVVWAIECKTSFGLAVIAQAARWFGAANVASVCVFRGAAECNGLGERLCAHEGIGVLYVSADMERRVIEHVAPTHRVITRTTLTRRLDAAQVGQDLAGGNGGHHTRFRATCQRLTAYVEAHPGVPLLAAVKAIEHHYSSDGAAADALKRRLLPGPGYEVLDALRGIVTEHEGDRATPQRIKLYPRGAT